MRIQLHRVVATSVPMLWSVLLRPIDEFSSSAAENGALELIRRVLTLKPQIASEPLEAERFELRHRFNRAYVYPLTVTRGGAATRENPPRAQFQDPSYMASLKNRKEQFEFGAMLPGSLPGLATEQVRDGGGLATYGTVRWDQISTFSRDLRLAARLASDTRF